MRNLVRAFESLKSVSKSNSTNKDGSELALNVRSVRHTQPPKVASLSEIVRQANTPEYLNKHRANKVRIIDSLNSLSRKAEHNKGPAPQPPKGDSLSEMVKP